MSDSISVLVYDLPSENYRVIQNSSFYDRVRALRVYAITKLHGLGVQCTESVILVSPSNMSRVQDIINDIMVRYSDVKREMEYHGIFLEFKPIIKVLSLTQQQTETFIELARRSLIRRIDEAIGRASRLLEDIELIVEEEKRRRIRYQTTQTIKEWSTILDFARELGIDVTREVEYLIEVLERIIERC